MNQESSSMRFAAIADVHGNRMALEAVLADIAALGIADIVNLGDHVSGPLDAGRTADLLIEHGFPSIRGDQDRRLVEYYRDQGGRTDRADYKRLERSHLEWLAGLPPTMTYRDDVFLCHGSPKNDMAYWLDRVTATGAIQATPIEDIKAEVAGTTATMATTASLILCGHTHIPRIVRLRNGQLVVNAGSVGCPGYTGQKPVYHKVETGTSDACYAILERNRLGGSATFRFVPYDHMSMADLAERNGSPTWASALATGWVC